MDHRSIQIPVVPSGGIGDGEGIRNALLADASAAMLGTRFVATVDSARSTPLTPKTRC